MATTSAARTAAIAAIGLLLGCGGPSRPPASDADDVQPLDAKPQWTQNDIEKGMDAIGPALIGCYQDAVKANRSESGSVVISASIAPDGHVMSATPVKSSLSKGLASCLADAVLTARFKGPGVTGVRLSIPLAFEQADGGAAQ
jgi:TonB family protein